MGILKTTVDNLHVVKIKTVSTDLSRLSNILDNGVLKKTVYNSLVTKVYAIDIKIPRTGRLVIRTQYDSDKKGLEKKIGDDDKKTPNASGLAPTQKEKEIGNKKASVTGLVPTAAQDKSHKD